MKRSDITDDKIVRYCHEFHTRQSDVMAGVRLVAEGFPEKVVYSAMDRCLDRGLIDFGTSLRGAFPTDKGLALISTSPVAEPALD